MTHKQKTERQKYRYCRYYRYRRYCKPKIPISYRL